MDKLPKMGQLILKRSICIFILFFMLVSFPACVTNPGTGSAGSKDKKTEQKVPDWFFTPPADDAKYKYFVGSGISKTANLSEAEEIAIGDLTNLIMMYIGVQVESDTTAEAKASLDSFETSLTQVVKTTGNANISGFEIMDKVSSVKEKEATIYILCRYNKKELEAEKERIKKIFDEQYEAVSIPEQKGKELAASGKYYEAAVKFIEAADASANEKLANAQVKFERNINQAKEAIEKINLIQLNDNLVSTAGEELTEPFELKVANGGSEKDTGVPGVNIRITYNTLSKQKDKLNTKTVSQKTDAKGMIEFKHPIPDYVGKGQVVMVLNFDDYLETLDDVPAAWYPAVDGLDKLISTKRVTYSLETSSVAKDFITGIFLIDLDAKNNPLKQTTTSSELLQRLTKEQFKIKVLSIKAENLLGKTDMDIIAFLSAEFSEQLNRVVFGTPKVTDTSKKDGKSFANSSATIQVVDLATQEIILTVVKNASGMGNTEDQAIIASLKKLGEVISKEIIDNLK